jgi:hypothetical protein
MRLRKRDLREPKFDITTAFQIHIDGSTQNNGKDNCYGYSAVVDEEGYWLRVKAVNSVMSSNICELYSFYVALQYLCTRKDEPRKSDNSQIREVVIFSDSLCICMWLKKEAKKVKCEHARKLLSKCHKLKAFLKICGVKIKLEKVGRENNRLADLIAGGKPPEELKNKEVKFHNLRQF